MKKKRLSVSEFVPLAIILTLGAIIFYLSLGINCGYDKTCFSNALLNCERAVYLSEEDNTLLEYKIKGNAGATCIMDVKVLEVSSQADYEVRELFEGKFMTCNIENIEEFTLGTLKYCSGPLKESMYELIIQKMYSLLAQNLGDLIYELQN